MTWWKRVLSPPVFHEVAGRYKTDTGFGLVLIGGNETALNRCTYYPWDESSTRKLNYPQMITESLRWGTPNIILDAQELYVWCVPVCVNNEAVGGVFSAVHPHGTGKESGQIVSKAAWKLLELTCRFNITNASLMQHNRDQGRTDAHRAEAIDFAKRDLFGDPRQVYLQEEFRLLSAIQKGEKEQAREIINRILLRIYYLGQGNLDVLKTLVLQMVVLMYRTAVDQGADPRELLGVNSSYLREYHEIRNEVDLSAWLTDWLETFISSSLTRRQRSHNDAISMAIEYMKNNLDQPITRDEVARMCNMSYSYFSRVFRQKTGHTFTGLLNRFRVQQACSLLEDESKRIYEAAYEAGFTDQSYLTKVFKKYVGMTPREYRAKIRPRAGAVIT